MTFLENMDSDMQDVILNTTEHAEEISVTVQGGSPKTINAIVNRDVYEEIVRTDQGLKKYREINVWFSTDATASIGDPATVDEATIDGKSWDFAQVLDKDGYGVKILMKRWEDIERSEEDHRLETT